MTGIVKITEKILSDAKNKRDEMILKAQEQAQSTLYNAKMAAEDVVIEASQDAQKKAKNNLALTRSKADTERKKALLGAKTEIINEIIDEALQKLKNLPAAEYFDTIFELVLLNAQAGGGELRFSQKDLKRLPKNFERRLNDALSKHEKSVKISKQTASLDGGFIIVYRDIEQNCSFDSLLSSSLDLIKDEVHAILFSGDED